MGEVGYPTGRVWEKVRTPVVTVTGIVNVRLDGIQT